jgi:hypothetical protein
MRLAPAGGGPKRREEEEVEDSAAAKDPWANLQAKYTLDVTPPRTPPRGQRYVRP